MKTHAGFKESVDKALEEALVDFAVDRGAGNSPEAIVARQKNGTPARSEIAPNKNGDAARPDIASACLAPIRQSSRRLAADDSQLAPIPAEFSGIIDHNSALLAVAGAAVKADCDPCLDAVVPELASVGITRDDIRAAVESGRFPRAFPHLTAETFERACAAAGEDALDCIEE